MGRNKIPPPSDGRRLAIYCRKSDAASGEARGRSTSQQLEACRIAAKALGFEVTDRLTFVENDGNKGDWFWRDSEGRHPGPHRPEMTRMMEEVAADNVDAVMVWRTDRYARCELVSGYFVRALRERGVRLFARTQDLAIHTASGYQAAATEAAMNKGQRDKISEDVARDALMRAQAGLLVRDPSCLGFRSGGKGTGAVVAVPEELATARLVFRLFNEGEEGGAPLSASAISVRLMELGLRTSVGAKRHKCKDPNLVHVGSVTRILRNPQYAGLILHDGRTYDTRLFDVPAPDGSGRLETVVPLDAFLEAKARLDSGDPFERDSRAKLLNGVVLCPVCGRKCYSQSRGAKFERSLYCPHRATPVVTCEGGNYRTLHVCDLEAWVREHLAPLLAAEVQAMAQLRSGDSRARELAAAERAVEEALRAEGEQLAALVGSMDAAQFAIVAKRLKATREAAERRAAEHRVAVRREASARRDPLDLVDEDEGVLRQALQRAVRWISVSKLGITVLTRTGAYIGAYLGIGDKRPRGGHRPPKLLPPSVQAMRECRGWIEDSARFIAGARHIAGRWGKAPSDEELLPAYLAEGAE